MTDLSIEVHKPKYGRIVLFQKNRDEPRDTIFLLTSKTCVIGCFETADIQISSASESLIHCKLQIEESTGEASLKVLCSEIQINETAIYPVTTIKLKHKDVIVVGGQRLQFEYPSAECKSIPTYSVDKPLNSLKNEIVEIDKNGEMFNNSSGKEKQERILPPCTSSNTTQRIWDHFWPFFNRKKFDNNHPTITAPIESTDEKGTTFHCPTSELKLIRPCIKPLIEEDAVVSERPTDQLVTVNETSECDGQYVDNSIISDNTNAVSAVPSVIDETAYKNLSALSEEWPNLPTATKLFSNLFNKFNMFKKNVSPVVAMSNQKEKEDISFSTEDMSETINSLSIDENKIESKEEGLSETLSQDQSFEEATLKCDGLFVNNSITSDEQYSINVTSSVDGLFTENSIASYVEISTSVVSVNETTSNSPSSDLSVKYSDHSSIADVENSFIDAMSIMEKDEMISHSTEDISEKSTKEDIEEVGSSSPKSLIEGFQQLLKTHKNVQTITESPHFDNANEDGINELLETPNRLTKNSTANQQEKAEMIGLRKNEARLFASVVCLTRCDALVKSPSQFYSTSSNATNRTGGEDSEEKLVLVRRSRRHRRPPRNIQTDTTPLVKGASRQTYARRVKSESLPFDIFDTSEDSLDEDAEPKKVTAYRTAVKRKMVEELQAVPNRRSKMSVTHRGRRR